MRSIGNGARREPVERAGSVVVGILTILATGAALGAAYNKVALGLPWIAEDRTKDPARLAAVAARPDYSDYATDETDPMAIGDRPPASASSLPEIPDLGRPILIELGAAKQFHDARAAVFVDAREVSEYGEGHIAGAISLPYDLAVSDPSRLEQLDTGGRAIITYCGGGGCEMSLQLANELMFMGQHDKVLVYEGGFPEWIEAGYPVETGNGNEG